MKIDLNNLFPKLLPTKQNIYKFVSSYQLFCFYLNQNVKINKAIISPFPRANGQLEKNPSFILKLNTVNEVIFIDFAAGKGDVFTFLKMLYGYNYLEAIKKIIIDFDLKDKFIPLKYNMRNNKPLLNNKIQERMPNYSDEKIKIEITPRKWSFNDLRYWNKYGIDLLTLNLYKVIPISRYKIIKDENNSLVIMVGNYSYAYKEVKDKEVTYKIYSPFSETRKWVTNNNNSVLQGWDLLPEAGSILIITKSLKDVMVIRNTLGVSAISVQNEASKLKPQILQNLYNRFGAIYLLFDNDFDKEQNYGQLYAKDIIEQYGKEFDIDNLVIPDKYKSKDISDMYINHGPDEIRKLFNVTEMLKVPF